ncbi:hypothetical protein K7X08_011923 [Anisodus acutangulus]|uniref:aminocyclopropanecarboxylate oxidase n=1 Tax=Anisodus acutangulus TaxID=402998 RepID=A0A9Q1LD51_9SOLA|nr:hypothetical protein K7X08_011923 [Anisodus acutangulus]
MEIPVIDFSKLESEERSTAMALLHQACEKWGFFMIENHGIDSNLMDNVKQLVNQHYEANMKKRFYESELPMSLEKKGNITNTDWESTFFVWHRPTSNVYEIQGLSKDLCKAVDDYIDQLIKVAENLSELMCENLGLEKSYIKEAFSGSKGPCVGTKVAIYPQCPRPDLVKGLREHTDAGGIILLLQDEQVPGLEFFKDGHWLNIPPSKNNRLFVNIGDQIEILSNGMYKSIQHRVMAEKDGNRLSIATFYNPAGEAIISPATKLVYPSHLRFQDYLNLYSKIKFAEKGPRFESAKTLTNGH